jgi:hypothetical protein
MPLFLVRYVITHLGHHGPEIVKERSHNALLVDSPTRVDAFATAYDYLSRQSLAVSTKLTNEYKGLDWNPDEDGTTAEPLNYCDMSDKDIDEIKSRGVPVDEFEGNTDIVSITEHKPKVLGHVISAEHQHVTDRNALSEAK